MSNFKTRKWQKHAFKVVDSHIENPISVNACVGSGKTSVACYSFGKFIINNRTRKTG